MRRLKRPRLARRRATDGDPRRDDRPLAVRATRGLPSFLLTVGLIAGPVEAFFNATYGASARGALYLLAVLATGVLVARIAIPRSEKPPLVEARRAFADARTRVRRILRGFAEPLVAAAFATSLLIALQRGFRLDLSWWALGPLELLFAFVGYLLAIASRHTYRGQVFDRLNDLTMRIEGPAKDPLEAMIVAQLDQIAADIEGVLSDEGLDMDPARVSTLTEFCFAGATHTYEGADGNLPSTFFDRYPTYLRLHERLLTSLGSSAPRLLPGTQDRGRRFLLVGAEDLRSDKINHPDDYFRFVEWHHEKGVPLFGVTPADAQAAKEAAIATLIEAAASTDPRKTKPERQLAQLETTLQTLPLDVALWHQQYALLFEPRNTADAINVKMRLHDSDVFRFCVSYLEELRSDDRCYDVSEEVPLFPKRLADAWEAYVDEEHRLNGAPGGGSRGLAAFLEDVLQGHRSGRILDAAAGIGSDSLWLIRQKIDVTANEIEAYFAVALREKFAAVGIEEPQLVRVDWRTLTDIYRGEWFEVVLVLGNSLCLVRNTDDRMRCLREFRDILKPGGILVVDERNWNYILRDRDDILSDPIQKFRYPRVIYTGTEVRSYPVAISKDAVVLEFFEAPHTRRNPTGRPKVIGKIETYPIVEPSLSEMLADAAFRDVTTYSDLELRDPIDPEATFYTYTARK
jgi:glycine/sarcosine N-methyltransferase